MSALRPARTRPAPQAGRVLAALAALVALGLGLWGCGPKPLREDSPPAEALWAASTPPATPPAHPGFSAAGSLNYAGAAGKAMRVEFLFWGNPDGGESATARRPELRPVLRLDTSAGFGTPVALWREDARGIEGYYPGEGTLYAHADPRAGAARMGLGVPLALGDLAALVCGGYDGLVPARYQSVAPTPEGGPLRVFRPAARLLADAGRGGQTGGTCRAVARRRLDPGGRSLRRGRRPARAQAPGAAHGQRHGHHAHQAPGAARGALARRPAGPGRARGHQDRAP